MSDKIATKLVLITGVSSGIGHAICEALLSGGWKVLGLGRSQSAVNSFFERFPEAFFFREVDLLNVSTIEETISGFTEVEGKLDGFVHCAGMEETLPLTMYTFEKIQHIFILNVFSGIEILRVVSKKKNSNDGSSMLFISSVMAELGQPGKVGYCASKAALSGVIKSSALELFKRKIRVNAILPGIVETPLSQKLFESLNQDQIDSIVKMHPLGIGTVEDIVPTVRFLLSNESRWITGQNIVIDGGYSIQ